MNAHPSRGLIAMVVESRYGSEVGCITMEVMVRLRGAQHRLNRR
jgi:hypothetical protein